MPTAGCKIHLDSHVGILIWALSGLQKVEVIMLDAKPNFDKASTKGGPRNDGSDLAKVYCAFALRFIVYSR